MAFIEILYQIEIDIFNNFQDIFKHLTFINIKY